MRTIKRRKSTRNIIDIDRHESTRFHKDELHINSETEAFWRPWISHGTVDLVVVHLIGHRCRVDRGTGERAAEPGRLRAVLIVPESRRRSLAATSSPFLVGASGAGSVYTV